ncbi:Pre-mRNA splicing factor PRP21 like protein-domain-containing protein [Sporodiniella umbellata]|nr:Pre-mRNA splicing factor PRP21 like protein-domain-containing protein [Sporodiniella umbellata]
MDNKTPVSEEQRVLAPKKPEDYIFSAMLPAMSAQDLDIIKLTAQFAARNGLGFIGQLMKRESRNYQFDFLHAKHSLFPYFTQLIEQYTKVIKPTNTILERLNINQTDKYQILDRVTERVEYIAWLEAEKKKKNDEDEKERMAYASVDWHDFVVVETVEFTDADEQADLPPPMSLAELENMSMAQKRLAAMPEPTMEENVKPEADDVDMEASDEETNEQAPSVIVPKMPEGPIKIRTDYKPKLIGTQAKASVPMQICPRCGEAVPDTEMEEHMRIELLDAKGKEQKLAMEAKIKDSNLLHGNDVARNLKNFSGLRPDIFDSDEPEAQRKLKRQQEESKKREKNIWDGHTSTMTLANQRAQQSSIEEQIAMMHRGDVGATMDSIGPQIPVPTYAPAYPHQTMYFPNQTLVNTAVYNPGMPPPVTPAIRKPEDFGPPDKKPRLEGEPEWPVHDPNAIHLTIQTPSLPDKPEWNLKGSPIMVGGLLPNTLVSTVKDRIGSTLGMPAGKQKLSTVAGTVLNNSKTLAFYGIMNGAALVLEVRKR